MKRIILRICNGSNKNEFIYIYNIVVIDLVEARGCQIKMKSYTHKERGKGWLTRTTPSLAASARISAQETVPLQAASTLVLMVSITS